MKAIFKIIMIITAVTGAYSFSYCEIPEGNTAVFSRYTGKAAEDSVLKETELYLHDVFYSTGRLIEVEYLKKMEVLKEAGGKSAMELYDNSAISLGIDRYFVLQAHTSPGRSTLNITVFEKSNGAFEKVINRKIYSYNYKNIPVKAGLFALEYVSKIPVHAKVIEKDGGVLRLDRGQWSGIEPGTYLTDRGKVRVISTGRYFSKAVMEEAEAPDKLVFKIEPATSSIKKRFKEELLENDVAKFGIDPSLKKRNGPVKESLISTCIINPGANFCFPIYGSFLSTEYLGLKKTEQHWPGLFIATMLLAGQITAVPAKVGFDGGYETFLPWIDNGVKKDADMRAQIALWAAIPFVYTASYFDQMSWQFERKGMLPPVFMNHDVAASLLSAFVPGGGLFYKGYRYTGWLFYTTEVSLLTYSVYNLGEREGRYGFAALGAVKLLDVIIAAALKPSYRVYRKEYGVSSRPDFNLYVNPDLNAGSTLGLKVSQHF